MPIDGSFKIAKNQGLSQAIAQELNLSETQCKQIKLSIWNQIFDIAENCESMKNGKVFNRNDFLMIGDEISFTANAWNKIQALVNSAIQTDYPDVAESDVTSSSTSQEVGNEAVDNTVVINNGDDSSRKIVVQIGETPENLAQQMGCTVEELQNANPQANFRRGRDGKLHIADGAVLNVPDSVPNESYNSVNANRQTQETIAQIKQQRRAHSTARFATQEEQYRELGLLNHNGQGRTIVGHYKNDANKNFTIIGKCDKGRTLARSENGELVVIAHDGVILKNDYVKNPEIYEQARIYSENVKTRKKAEKLAQEFYQIADKNSGHTSMAKMKDFLNRNINSNNIVAFLDAYDNDKVKRGDSSIIDTIISETGASKSTEQATVLWIILYKLELAAKKAGVSESSIKKAEDDFNRSLKKENRILLVRINPKEMEKAIDFLRGEIAAKLNNNGQISNEEAIQEFITISANENNTAKETYENAREEEGWIARTGDTVCGWFGCTTISDMDKKLGKNANAVKKLAESQTEAEFKENYYQVFGIDFDKDKIAARQSAIEKYDLAQSCSLALKSANACLQKQGNLSELTIAIKNSFGISDDNINQIINSYAEELGITDLTDENKNAILIKFLNDTKEGASQNYKQATNGKTLEQMAKDIDLITRSAFGTSDIVKDVVQFNENLKRTEMITEAAFEIAGTIALQFVPGLGQVAAARLAASAARWGVKGAKVIKYANKAEKAFSTAHKLQKGEIMANATTKAKIVNRSTQVVSQMVSAGVATGGVDLSDGNSVKETTRKVLMNMSFAGVGASSSILAPKLMQSFGIVDKALANEIAEEICNAAGSYGVTKVAGGEYGETDAFIDFASGLILSRISHVNTAKVAPTQPHTPKAPESSTPVLDKAVSSNQTPLGVAHPADVHVGSKKAVQIQEEVQNVVADPNVTPEALANARGKVEAIQNRGVRRKERLLDEAAKQMNPAEQQRYQEINHNNLEAEINHIMEKHSGVGDTDRRKISEYIETLNDENELNSLKAQIHKKYTTRGQGMTTDNYNMLMKQIDDRIKTLCAPRLNVAVQREAVLKMLGGNSGKGLSSEEFKSVREYLANIENEAQLDEFKQALANRKLGSAHKRVLKQEIEAKSNALKTVKEANAKAEEEKARAEAEEKARAEAEAKAKAEEEKAIAEEPVERRSDKHIENINDIPDMRNKTFSSVDEAIEFFEHNGYTVKRKSELQFRLGMKNLVEYKCTTSNGSGYEFVITPDGTAIITSVSGRSHVGTSKQVKSEPEPAEVKPVDGEPVVGEREVKAEEEKARAEEPVERRSDKHIENINDIPDMRNKTFSSVDEAIEFFEYNGYTVKRKSKLQFRLGRKNLVEYKCTTSNGSSYEFVVNPDGTAKVKPLKKDVNPPTKSTNIPEVSKLTKEELMTVHAEYKNSSVKTADGRTIKYDENGYIKTEYDQNGKMICYISRNADGSVNWYKDYEYNQNGKITREIERNADGRVNWYHDYEYDKNGNNTRYISRKAGGRVNWYEDYEYDQNGKITRRIYRNADGSVGGYYDNEYDQNGNNTRYISRKADGSVEYYYDYEYDQNGKRICYISRNADGSVNYYYDYEYDQNGNMTRSIMRNADGSER